MTDDVINCNIRNNSLVTQQINTFWGDIKALYTSLQASAVGIQHLAPFLLERFWTHQAGVFPYVYSYCNLNLHFP